jgi:hypothetical protein
MAQTQALDLFLVLTRRYKNYSALFIYLDSNFLGIGATSRSAIYYLRNGIIADHKGVTPMRLKTLERGLVTNPQQV